MSQASFIQTQQHGLVARVILARPELHNAFNDAMIADLTETFERLGQLDSVRVIVLQAQGKSFCAGADLNWMQSMLNYTYAQNVEDAGRLAQMLQTIAECPKPVIGRIHGAAFGGGVGLTSVCDMSVALESATFCLSEVKLGLLPAVISPFVLTKIPVAQAQRYFLTAEKFSASQACQMGLVSNVVVTDAELDTTIDNWIAALCQNGPEAVKLGKQLIRDVAGLSFDDARAVTTEAIAGRRVSVEGQEGMRAFLEKRPANWLQDNAS